MRKLKRKQFKYTYYNNKTKYPVIRPILSIDSVNIPNVQLIL